MNLGSKFNKVKQQASFFLRGDKTDVIGTLREAEDKADELRVLSDAISRSLEKRLFTYNVTDEKKIMKVPEMQVSEGLKEALTYQTSDETEKSLFRCVVEEAAVVERLLGNILIDYEEQVGREVLPFLHNSLKDDFPLLSKQKKALKQAGQDLDAAKARLRNSLASNTGHTKLDNQRYEVDEAESKLEQIKDIYACDLFTTVSQQREVARLTCVNMELKLDFLQRSVITLNTMLPPIQKLVEESPCGPVYSVPLHEHLRITQRKIALPIEACVKRLIEIGLREEGLFRVAGSANKVKRLRAAFDAGIISDVSLSSSTTDYDVHVVAGALKSYLRELPEPLLTHVRHDQWTEAAGKADHDERLRALWQVATSLPEQNYRNLVYVIKFLAMLASNSSHNKMTANNIAIVMAPNLIWTQRDGHDQQLATLGRDMNLTNDYRIIVEQMIEYCGYFFKEEIDFGILPLFSENDVDSDQHSCTIPPNVAAIKTERHKRNNSSDLGFLTVHEESEHESPRQPQRNKRGPAPKPPALKKVDMQSADSTPEISPNLRRSHSPPVVQLATRGKSRYIRRPTEEPPLPPTQIGNRPPRPNPPSSYEASGADSKVNAVKENSHKSFENISNLADENNVAGKIESESVDQINTEDNSELHVCMRESTAASSGFRKSLEGLLKHPQALPRHLTRMSTSYTDGATDLSPVKVAMPVAAQRSFRKNQSEKMELVGSDKPIIPGKPTVLLSRPADNSRPLVPEKPSSLSNKTPSNKID